MSQLSFIDAGLVLDLRSGISYGLKYRYRLLKHDGHWFIFNVKTGAIVECIVSDQHQREETERWLTEQRANERLMEINGIQRPNQEDLARIDSTP